MKLQNTFSKGTINKDSDSRFVDSEEMIDAENFFVTTVDGSSGGIGKNALGNSLKTAYNIVGGKTIGVGIDTSSNKVYNLVKGTNHDYVIEYDPDTKVSAIVAQSTTGTRLNFKSGERVRNVDVIVSGTPYDAVTQEGGNLLKFSGDSNPPRVININRWKENHLKVGFGINWFTAEEIMLIKAPPLYPPSVELVNTVDNFENFISDKFLSFSYRYKYKDGYHSAISSWQEYSFAPGKFNLDFSTLENKGMENIYNACNITFNTGPREVAGVDLLFKTSNSDIVYLIDKFIKTDEEWADAENRTIQFNNSKVYSILPQDQYYRSFDNVPEQSVAATFMGNRALYANYKDGKPMVDSNNAKVLVDYTTQVVSVPLASENINVTQTNFPSPVPLVAPFTIATIAKGALSVNFTGAELKEGGILFLTFDLESSYLNGVVPVKNTFTRTYNYVILKDYATIQDLVNDTTNGFKTGLEGTFSVMFKETAFNAPSEAILPFTYIGFTVVPLSSSTIAVKLPTVQYTINQSPNPNTYVNEFFYNVSTVVTLDSSASKKSMKSYRSYEICQIYRDAQGRKTTALTSKNNTVFIPIHNSTTQNKIQVTIPATQKPPKWATTYKFGLKENRGAYEVIYSNIFYVDGVFRWIRIDGENKNKVKEGDLLLVKADILNTITTVKKIKVLEIKLQEKDFLVDNKDSSGQNILEQAGLYMKIKPENLSLDYSADEFIVSEDNTSTQNNRPFSYLGIGKLSKATTTAGVYVDIPIRSGAILDITLHANRHNDDSNRMNDYKRQFIANADYISFEAFYNAEIANIEFKGQEGQQLAFNKSLVKGNFATTTFSRTFVPSATGQTMLRIEGTASGNGNWSGFLWASLNLRNVNGYLVLETLGKETNNEIYYETPEVYNVVNGDHQQSVHLLNKTFNCFAQGNGAESYQIKDSFNQNYVSVDFLPTAVSQYEYGETNRPTDITYSGVYNSSSNVNKLNEFNLYTANFKDDIDKSYGAIYKIKGEETNLQVYQEDKDSQVFYGKDFLFNADGSANLSKISEVLGSQDFYVGDFGISTHADSYDSYGNNAYHTDVSRGVVIKKSNNGLFEISSQGLKNYFKTLFRDNVINHVNGTYDQFNDVYVLNIQYNTSSYVTWVYSDKDNGWLGRMTFNPEDMCCINGKFLAFKNGEIYEHNQLTGRNTFFGVEYPSKFTFNFSQSPSERKIYKTTEIEGTDAWQLSLETDLDKGYINAGDFEKQEGVYRAYIRTSNDAIDSSLLSCQGIGNCTINGLVLNFGFTLDDVISIGDEIRNSNLQLVGTILSKTPNSLTLNAVANIVNGDFVLCSKPQSAESPGLLGYHMVVTATLSKNTKTEVYAINTESSKSFV